MLIAGHLLLQTGSGAGAKARLARGWVLIEGGSIKAVGEGDAPGTPDLGGEGCVVSPGFVDAHCHLPQFDRVGQDGMPLMEWLRTVIFPAEAKWEDAAFAAEMTGRVARRLLSNGTTTIAAYATVHAAGTRAAMLALRDAGVRAIVGQVLMDQEAPAELIRPAAQLLGEAAATAAWARGEFAAGDEARVQFAINPRFAITCSGELLSGAGELARAQGLTVQTHLGETRDEQRLALALHPGHETYTEIYERAGLLTDKTLLAHGIYLTPEERSLIRAASSVIAHCPTANTFLQSGLMPRREYAKAGLNLALGSDIAGGPDVSMVRVARAMIDTAKQVAGPASERSEGDDPRIPSPAKAWWQITTGNALALGLTHSGRLAAGMDADVLVIRPDETVARDWATSSPDALGMLMYGWDDRWLKATITAGVVRSSI